MVAIVLLPALVGIVGAMVWIVAELTYRLGA